IEYLIDRCDRSGLNFVPVIGPSTDARRLALTREVAGNSRGICVRLPVTRAIPEMAVELEIDRLLNEVGVRPESADIVVDLEYIDPEPGYDTTDLQRILVGLPYAAEWRSLILTGTVVPPTLGNFDEGTITPIHRW